MATFPITINDLDFNTGEPDADGVHWKVDITAGWDAAELRQDLLDTLTEGSALGGFQRRHRTIVCEGTVVAPSDEAHWAAYNRLTGLVGIRAAVPFIVAEPGGAKMCTVVTGPGSPKIRTHNGRVFEFQLTLVALDPRKYAVEARSVSMATYAGGVAVPNLGSVPSPLRITLGTLGIFHMSEPGGVVDYQGGPFPTGTVLDSATRTVRAPGGTNLFHLLAPGFTWPMSAGPGQQFMNVGPTPFTITYRDAWI